MNPQERPPPQQLVMAHLMGKFVSRALTVVAELAVADHLKDGPLSAEALAQRTSSNPDALYRLLRALSAVGVFEERPGKQFANNDASHLLRGDVQGSLRAMIRWINDPSAWTAWGALDYSVKTGKPAFDHLFGAHIFDYFKKNEHTAQVFNAAMTGFSAMVQQAVLEAYDFSGISTLVDVGGGHGALLSAVLSKHGSIRGVLFDLPEVIEGAQEVLTASGQAGRIETVGGSFFDGVPKGGDAYMMKAIIHDWSDDHCVQILGNCRQAMNAGGRVLLIENLISDRPEAAMGKLVDLEMLVMTPGGRERTEPEFRSLLERAGLRLQRIVPTQSPAVVVEAVAL